MKKRTKNRHFPKGINKMEYYSTLNYINITNIYVYNNIYGENKDIIRERQKWEKVNNILHIIGCVSRWIFHIAMSILS